MLKIFLGILIVFGGYLIVWKSEWFLRNFGPIPWAEEHFGPEGGSRLFYKLLGIAVIFLGIFVMTGIWNDLLNVFAGLIGLGR